MKGKLRMWGVRPIRSFCMTVALAGTLGTASVQAQEPTGTLEQFQAGTLRWGLNDVSLLSQDPHQASTTTDGKSPVPDAPTTKINAANPSNPDDQYGKQPKRILWVIPNYRAVSANTHLPPLSFKNKFWLATQDTFDYSDFIFVAGLAGISMANKSQPSFKARRRRLRSILLAPLCRRRHRELHDGSDRASGDQRRPQILHHGQRSIHQADWLCGKSAVHHQDRRGKEHLQYFGDRGGWSGRGHRQCVLPSTIQPLGENVSTLGNGGGLGWCVHVLKEFWPDINKAIFRGKY